MYILRLAWLSLTSKASVHFPRFLGVDLFWDVLILALARSEYFQLRLVHQLCLLSYKDFTMVIHDLVICQLNYFDELYLGLALKMT